MQYVRKASAAGKAQAAVDRVLPAARPGCACTTVRRASRRLTQLYDDALAPTGLRITQYSLLATLDGRSSIAMTELANVLGMDRTTLTRNLAPLQRARLLSLCSAGAGRTKLVGLTQRGRARLREALPYWERAQRRFDEAVGQEPARDLARLAAVLERSSVDGCVRKRSN